MVASNSITIHKDIPGFQGYRVGDDGSVWSCLTPIYRPKRRYVIGSRWRKLKPKTLKNGYLEVCIRTTEVNGKRSRKSRMVHTLMLKTFIGKRPVGMECCHEDGDKTNNILSNLRWDTPKNNAKDKARHGTQIRGETYGMAKLTEEKVIAIRRERKEGMSCRRLGEKYGVGKGHIWTIVTRKCWAHV